MSTPDLALVRDPEPAPAAAPAVVVRGLVKRYGKLNAVDGIDLTVPTGSIFGLIGPNGAGKTTTFAILASLLRPTSGVVSIAGFDPRRDTRDVRRRVGYMPDSLGLYANLTVDEYLTFFAAAYKVPPSTWPALVDGLLELVDLGVKREARVDSLSRGMKQRLSLARALVHDPEVLILDEPASGLDPRARVELRGLLVQLGDMGKTVVISSHILAELEEVCSHVAIMEAGKVVAQGNPVTIGEEVGGRHVRVRFADGSEEQFPVADEAEQAALLRRLVVEDGRDVLEFARTGSGLEEVFLKVTQGIVQ
jgi:ABC-2 type transport system ATP-binding protein